MSDDSTAKKPSPLEQWLELNKSTGGAPNSIGGHYNSPNYQFYRQPCPSCGHCPTCGRGGHRTFPFYGHGGMTYYGGFGQ